MWIKFIFHFPKLYVFMSFILFLVKTSTNIRCLLQICHPYHVVAFFVFLVSQWLHIFWTPKETCFKNNYLVCTGTHEPSEVTSHGSTPTHFMASLMRFSLWSFIPQASSYMCLFHTIFSGFAARNENFLSLSWTFSHLIWSYLSQFSAFYKYSRSLRLPVFLPFLVLVHACPETTFATTTC